VPVIGLTRAGHGDRPAVFVRLMVDPLGHIRRSVAWAFGALAIAAFASAFALTANGPQTGALARAGAPARVAIIGTADAAPAGRALSRAPAVPALARAPRRHTAKRVAAPPVATPTVAPFVPTPAPVVPAARRPAKPSSGAVFDSTG